MYYSNYFKFGYWIIRDTWKNYAAKIIRIEGVTEGEGIKGRSPYFGNPKVYAEFYKRENEKLVFEKEIELNSPGNYSYHMVTEQEAIDWEPFF